MATNTAKPIISTTMG